VRAEEFIDQRRKGPESRRLIVSQEGEVSGRVCGERLTDKEKSGEKKNDPHS